MAARKKKSIVKKQVQTDNFRATNKWQANNICTRDILIKCYISQNPVV